jgi:alpha-L-fucosidase
VDAFVDAVAKLDGEAAYRALRTRFGVLRSSERFWAFSDRMNADHRKAMPDTVGLFDYSRLEAY